MWALVPPVLRQVSVLAVSAVVPQRFPHVRVRRRYLLSIFTFIAKCTGVSELDFETLVHDAGLSVVVFNTPVPPSAAAAQASSASPTDGLEDGGPASPTRRGAGASKAGAGKGGGQRSIGLPKRSPSKLTNPAGAATPSSAHLQPEPHPTAQQQGQGASGAAEGAVEPGTA